MRSEFARMRTGGRKAGREDKGKRRITRLDSIFNNELTDAVPRKELDEGWESCGGGRSNFARQNCRWGCTGRVLRWFCANGKLHFKKEKGREANGGENEASREDRNFYERTRS